MLKCKRVMRLTLRILGFRRAKCDDAGFFQFSRIDPDQELHNRVRRASGHVHVNSPLRE
jgi:hypothetical protein